MEELKDSGLSKLIDVVSSGIGSVAGPMLARWKAIKESEANVIAAEGKASVLLIQAQAQADARRLLDDANLATRVDLEIADGIKQRIEYQERKRQANIAAVVGEAALHLRSTTVPAVEPDHDWAARFFNEVQDVSSDEMHVLWGRVLAGEVQAPGTTSIRTLGILRNLDTSTARLYSRFCSAAVYLKARDGHIHDGRVPSLGGDASQNALAEYGFSFDTLNRLNELGLIIADYNSYKSFVFFNGPADGDEVDFCHQGVCWDGVIEEQAPSRKNVVLHGVAMTVSGCELSKVVLPEAMPEYTEALKQFFLHSFKVKLKQEPSTKTRDPCMADQ